MNFLLAAEEFVPFEPTKGEAAILAVLGLVIVFVVLAVLVGILTVFKLIFNIKLPSKKKKEEPVASHVEAVTAGEDESEIVAVIAAALACLGEEEEAPAPFRIKSIRRLK